MTEREEWISSRTHTLCKESGRSQEAAYDHWYRAAGEFDVLDRRLAGEPLSPPREVGRDHGRSEAVASAWMWN